MQIIDDIKIGLAYNLIASAFKSGSGGGDVRVRLAHRIMGGIMQKGISNLDPNFFNSLPAGGELNVSDIDREPYKHHPWVYACAWAIARNISRMPIVLYHEDDPDEVIRDHPILTLLRQPNPLQTRTPFLQSIILHLLLPSVDASKRNSKGGQAFVIPLKSLDMGDTVDLRRGDIPNFLLEKSDRFFSPIKQKQDNGLESFNGWRYKPDTTEQIKFEFMPREIIRINTTNPYDALQGLASYTPVQLAVAQDITSDLHNTRIFENNGMVAGVMKKKSGTAKREQMREYMKQWYENFGGPGNNNRIAFLNGDWDYTQLGMSNVDMQYADMKLDDFQKILSGFGLNKIAIGQYEKINRATIEKGHQIIWQDGYLPYGSLIEEAFNHQWIMHVTDGLRMRFDKTAIRELRPNYDSAAKTVKTLTEANVPTLEAMRIAQIPTGDDWEEKYPWMLENPAAHRSKPGLPVPADGGNSDEDKSARQSLAIAEREYKAFLINYFVRQRNQIQNKIDEWRIAANLSGDKSPDIKGFLPVKDDQDQELIDFSEQLISKIVLEVNPVKPNFADIIDDRSQYMRGMNSLTFETLENELNKVFDHGRADNYNIDKLAKESKKLVNALYQARKSQTNFIAQSEIDGIIGQIEKPEGALI